MSNQPLPQPTKPGKSPIFLGLSDLLTWFLNNDVGNGLNIANDVNVNVNDVNYKNGASKVNTVDDEKKFLINQFPNIKYLANVKLIRNIFSVSLKSWGECCLCLCFCLYLCCLCFSFLLLFYVQKKTLLLNFGKNLGSNID